MKGIYKISGLLIVMATMLLVTVVLLFLGNNSLPEVCWKSCAGPSESLWKRRIHPEERLDLLTSLH